MSDTDQPKIGHTFDEWQPLRAILDQVSSRGIRSLSSEQLLDFGRLYRRAAARLSLAKTQGLDRATIEYLNDLVTRAYGRIYASESKGLRTVPRFFSHELPACFRRNVRYIGLALAFVLIAAIPGFLIGFRQELADALLDPTLSEFLDRYADAFRHGGDLNPAGMRPLMSAFYVTNNTRVAILCFALGIFAGLGTVLVLLQNGLIVGIFSGALAARGAGANFWGFVVPHGVFELTAIFMAAGGGLMLGAALLSPGDLTRKEALKAAARESFKLVLGAAALLAIAAMIEAYLSPTAIPNQLKFAFAAAMALLLLTYFTTAGRSPRR